MTSDVLEVTRTDIEVFETTTGMPGIGEIMARRGKIVIVEEKKVNENGNTSN